MRNYYCTSSGSRIAPRYFTGVCQKWRDIPLGRGIYVLNSAREDDFYLLQRKYGRGIYSHDTALYLLGYSDRTPCEIYDDFS